MNKKMLRSAKLLLSLIGVFHLHLGWCLPQSFRVVPHSVEVVAGSDIILPCEVDNQQGRVQWTKDGFALGFNRSVPGFSRYTMLGEESAGVHSLQILDVNIRDNADFQCQVMPAGNAQPIRHAANVTVLLPPTSIDMVGRAPDAQVTVKAGGDSVTLECLIKDSKPVSSVAWYRENEPLIIETMENTKETSDTKSYLASLRSKITLSPTHADNGLQYSCHAVHTALERTHTHMTASVYLDVQYPPGAPQITGYTEGEIVRAGERKTLTCRARGGNPLPEVFWYKNGAQIDKKYIKHQNYAINEYDFVVEASDNLAKYKCHVMNLMMAQPKMAEIQLRVNFAPSSVKITAPDEARVGDIITVSCVAQNSNPPADVNLVINAQTPPGATSKTQKVHNGGWSTITNLSSYEVRSIDSDLTVNCYALNQALGSTKIDTKVISVLRPPEMPVILGYEFGRRLRKGDPHRLSCISSGGNPLASLQWYKGSETISTETRHEAGQALAELNLVLEESDNGAEYRCEATNLATIEPLVNSTVLSVMFPPERVNVKTEPNEIRANSQVTLICESSSSNPPTNVSWWRDGFEVERGDMEVIPGPHGGSITKYTVRVEVTAEDNGALYTCEADNTVDRTSHGAINLVVRYPPLWLSPPNEKLEVTEGENVEVTVNTRANPKDVTYLWHRGEEVVMGGNLLNVTGVTRDQGGLYTVEASNDEGSTALNISIIVKYPPVITSVSRVQNVSEGEAVSLLCLVDSNPTSEMTWKRKGYDFSGTERTTHENKNVVELIIKNVTKKDTGVFTCHAENGIGDGVTADSIIIVKHKPEMDESPQYQKAAAEAGGNARLVCRAKGAPNVHFTWHNKDNTPIEQDIYSRFENRYSVKETKLVDDLVTYESVLIVTNVTSKDYGFFQCNAKNPLGSSRTAIHLDGTSKPDTPLDLGAVNITHDTVKLRWTPGFDGGLIQKYRVRYSIADTNRYQYADVYPENVTTFSVSRLSLATTYAFSILAYNNKGESPFSTDKVQATTLSTAPPTDEPPPGTVAPEKGVSRLLIAMICLVAAALVALNIALIACFIRRRALKRLAAASSDKGSSKGTTIEMYAPSSYNGTVTGETLSSISEKSRESFDHEDSVDEYEAEAARVTAASTYLIEQLEPPPQYASRPPTHILPPPPQSHNDLHIDDAYDDVRRNQLNAALDRAGGYGTLGRRVLASDHFNISGTEGQYSTPGNHYNTYQPPSHALLTAHTHAHTQNNGSLRRNPSSKLHFPKDYIRNSSLNIQASTSPTMSDGQFSAKPQSPTRTQPLSHTPMLSTFAPEGPLQPTGIPLEHRGHLV